MCTLTSYNLSIPKHIYPFRQRSRFCHKCECLPTVCISIYSVYNELCGCVRVAPNYASRTMCESHFIVQVAFYASRMWPLGVALYFCESHFSFLNRTLLLRVTLEFVRVVLDLCESYMTTTSHTWLLRVAHDFYESHFVRVAFYSTSRILCESYSNCASRTLCESHFLVLPLPPKSPPSR